MDVSALATPATLVFFARSFTASCDVGGIPHGRTMANLILLQRCRISDGYVPDKRLWRRGDSTQSGHAHLLGLRHRHAGRQQVWLVKLILV